jgi:hypothetical protein
MTARETLFLIRIQAGFFILFAMVSHNGQGGETIPLLLFVPPALLALPAFMAAVVMPFAYLIEGIGILFNARDWSDMVLSAASDHIEQSLFLRVICFPLH